MLNSLETVIVVPIFIIIMIASHKAIEEGLKISGRTSWILAVCVAGLAMIGMTQPASNEPSEKDTRDFILLPYALYGISCILAMLLGLLFRNPKRKERILRWFTKRDSDADDRIKR